MLVQDDKGRVPFEVMSDSGRDWWYAEGAIEIVVAVGSKVRVKPGVDPRYGWGTNVDSSSVGTVKRLMADGDVKVDFPGRSSEWTGVASEMEVVGGGGGGGCGPSCDESHGTGDICHVCNRKSQLSLHCLCNLAHGSNPIDCVCCVGRAIWRPFRARLPVRRRQGVVRHRRR